VHEQVRGGSHRGGGPLPSSEERGHQALGGSTEPKVDILETEVEEGDVYLLCSDGLNSMLSDDEIANELRTGGALKEMAERLIVGANERGGNDNITVVLLRPQKDARPSTG
jgi:protein phosphatase